MTIACFNSSSFAASEWATTFSQIYRVRGMYYGIGASGVSVFGGPSDDGASIPVQLITHPNDLGSEHIKRVRGVWAEVLGDIEIEAFVDGASAGTGVLSGQDKRARFARGVRGRFVGCKITSEDPQFLLVDLVADINVLKRRFS